MIYDFNKIRVRSYCGVNVTKLKNDDGSRQPPAYVDHFDLQLVYLEYSLSDNIRGTR